MGFAEQLKKARLAKGYTQQQVADAMGITNSTYCGYETGKRQPDVEKIKQLAIILDTSGDILLETGINNEGTKKVHPSKDERTFSENYKKAIELFSQLSPELQYEAEQYLEFLVSKQAAPKKK